MSIDKWALRYINLAKEIAQWSLDPSTKVGAVIIGANGQIVSQGFNGFPRGIKDTEARLNDREEKYKYMVHAEMNCIYNASLNGSSLKDTTLYVYGLPVCSECAKGVAQVGISKVVMVHPKTIRPLWEEKFSITQTIFEESGVEFKRYNEELMLNM